MHAHTHTHLHPPHTGGPVYVDTCLLLCMLSSSICSFMLSFVPPYIPDFMHLSSIHLSDTCPLLCRVHAAIYHPSLCCTHVVVGSQSPHCACYALLTDRQTGRQHMPLSSCQTLKPKSSKPSFCVAPDTACQASDLCSCTDMPDPHMKPQYTSPPGLLCPSNVKWHNPSFLFWLGEYTTTGNMLRPLIHSKAKAWSALWREPDFKVAFQT